MDGIV